MVNLKQSLTSFFSSLSKNKNLKKLNFPIGAFCLVVILWILSMFGLASWGKLTIKPEKYITVTGTSSALFSNQVASFNIHMASEDVSKETAVKNVNSKARTAFERIKTFGIDENDIKTSSMNIYQREDMVTKNGVQRFTPGNWYAGLDLEITLRDLTKVNDLAAFLAELEVDSIYGPNLTLNKNKIDETKLLQSAFDNAKEKAQTLSKYMKKHLGKVVSVTEGNPQSLLMPYSSFDRGGGGAEVISPGTSEVSKSVTVTFELK